MNKTSIQVLALHPKGGPFQVFDVQTALAGDSIARIRVKSGLSYQIKPVTPPGSGRLEYTTVKRAGQDLVVSFIRDHEEARVLLEDFFTVVPEGFPGLVGQASDGSFYEYVLLGDSAEMPLTSLMEAQNSSDLVLGRSPISWGCLLYTSDAADE